MMRSRTQFVVLLAVVGIIAVYAVAGPLSARPVSAQGGPKNELAERVAALELQVAELTGRLQHVYLDEGQINGLAGPHLIIEGCNVHVRSGSGATDDLGDATVGCGNLIVGYNEPGDEFSTRTGSHNLVIGRGHTYVSYGGLVAGELNSVTGPACSVTGGADNIASGDQATVTGGLFNEASGVGASVNGGRDNLAGGAVASVSGGVENVAGGVGASVSGGATNEASGAVTSVSGGGFNMAGSVGTTISGGRNNETVQSWATVSGGAGNIASHGDSTVSGGIGNATAAEGDHVP